LSVEAVGDKHVNTLDSQHFLAKAYLASGQRQLALRTSINHYKHRVDVNGKESLETMAAKQMLAESYLGGPASDTQKALELLRNLYEQRRNTLGDDHVETMETATSLANVLIQTKQFDEAVELALNAYEVQSKRLGGDHPLTLRTMTIAASAMEFSGRVEEAIKMHEAAFEANKAKLGEAHMETLLSEFALTLAYIGSGRVEQASELIGHLNSMTSQLRATAGQDNTLPYKIAALSLLDSYELLPLLQGSKDTLRTFGSVSTSLPLVQKIIVSLVLRQGIRGFLSGDNRILQHELSKIFAKSDVDSRPTDDVLSDQRPQDLGDDN
jgi:tetratricopeptide (TPR) repeat protein